MTDQEQYGEGVREFASWLHEEYEEIAVEVGWETQDGTSVPFGDLPEENQQVMLELAKRIRDRQDEVAQDGERGWGT